MVNCRTLSFRALRCHPELFACRPEPFACHSERSEESRSAAQGKLREASYRASGSAAAKLSPWVRAKGGSWRYRTPRCLRHKHFQSGVRDLRLILLLAGDFHLFEWAADP
jgi:hypothetical protein